MVQSKVQWYSKEQYKYYFLYSIWNIGSISINIKSNQIRSLSNSKVSISIRKVNTSKFIINTLQLYYVVAVLPSICFLWFGSHFAAYIRIRGCPWPPSLALTTSASHLVLASNYHVSASTIILVILMIMRMMNDDQQDLNQIWITQ